ncbi:very short patch repair endonuclease [Roseobacter sp. MED193]|uniref:very short patch repair endonuclease n=1 Tax=Roseobacter sp. MED193 TaxID=314262 RepID=UPI0003221ED3|nr:DNA mismatch endonuclease Vsr [Roseobacter sp. MED193]
MPEKRSPMSRSEMMAGIRPKDTKPEMIVRKGLHGLGFRYRLHSRHLVGKPDLVLPKYRAALFVHGCFWHAHNGCSYFRLPKTRTEFWREKLEKNVERDQKTAQTLTASGWRVLTVWECATKRLSLEDLIGKIAAWLRGKEVFGEIPNR